MNRPAVVKETTFSSSSVNETTCNNFLEELPPDPKEKTRQNMAGAGARPKVKKEEEEGVPATTGDVKPIDAESIIYCGHPSKEYQEFESLTAGLVSSMNTLKVTGCSLTNSMDQWKGLKKILDKTSTHVKEKIKFLTNASKTLPWRFHDRHGEHIVLLEERTIAVRSDKDSKSVVISEMPMDIGRHYKVKVESMASDGKLTHYLAVGVTWTDPKTRDNDIIKNTLFASELTDSVIINVSDIIHHKGSQETFTSSYGNALKTIKQESTVEIELDSQNRLHLYIDGKEGKYDNKIDRFRFILPCWAVFDVRGKCKSIKIVPCATSV